MSVPVVVTVGREFCSGGAEIAKKVAEQADFKYYDKNIIDHTADVLKMSTETVEHHDEKPVPYTDLIGYQYGAGLYADDPSLMLPLGMQVADAQFRLVRKYAEEGPCVIVGRCADYVLREREHLLTVFIHSGMECRIARAKQIYGIDDGAAKKLIKKTDRVRANYYENYTQNNWGGADTYAMLLDSGKLGVDGCVAAILGAVKSMK